MANATSTELQELYVAYFGRAADPTGLDYWTEKGITTTKFAADMYAQAEFKDAYGSKTVEAQVNQIYKNLFDREADVTGLTYWTQQINLGNLKVAEIATHLIWAAKNNSGSADDKTALTNRTNAAVAYTAEVKSTAAGILAYAAQSTSPTFVAGDNITEAKTYLEGIDKSTAYTAAGITTSVNKIIAKGDPTVIAKTITLTTLTDTGAAFTGTATADTFNADNTGASEVTSVADTLAGGAGTDTLNIYSDGTIGGVPVTSGIETFNIYDEDTDLTLTAASQPDVTTVNLIRSDGIAVTTVPLSVTTVGWDTITLAGDGGGTADTTAAFDATATSATVTLDNLGTAAGNDDEDINVTGAKITTVTIKAVGAKSNVDNINLPAATSVTVDAAVGLTLNLATGGITTTGADATLTLTGAGAMDLSKLDNDFDTVAGSAATGKITLIAPADNKDAVITLGSGADKFTTDDDGFATTDKFAVNAGTGEDTLVVAADADVNTADEAARYTNFDVLQRAIDANLDVSNFTSTIDSASIGDGGLLKMGSAMAGSIALTADNAGSTFTLADATGTSDVLTITSAHATATTSADLTTTTITGFETLNFAANSGDKLVTTATDLTAVSFSGATDLTTITATGSKAVSLDFDANAVALTTVDASGVTGGAVLISGGQTGALTVTGSAVQDTITVGAVGTGGSITVNAGAGNDTLTTTQAITAAQTINLGAGTDTLHISDTVASTATLTINDSTFKNVTGVEVIDFSNATLEGDLIFTLGGYSNSLASAASGNILKITSDTLAVGTAATDIVTIDASGLSGTNAVNIDIKNTLDTATKASPITITGSDGADTIKVEEAKAAAASTISITGGKGNDTITVKSTATHNGKVVINSGAGDDTIDVTAVTTDATVNLNLITPGAGDDTIKLATEGANTSFEIVTAATAALTGTITVTNYTIGTGGDVINADAYKDWSAVNATALTANPGSSTAVENDVNFLVDITGGQDITTASGLNSALASAGEYSNVDMAASKKALFVTAASNAAGQTQHLFFASSDTGGGITVTKVGTIADEDIDSFVAANFNA
jgi:hypothetical protein